MPYRDIGRGRVAAEKKRAREDKLQQEQLSNQYKTAWMEIKDTQYPARPDEMEQFFLKNITEAETLHAQGSSSPSQTHIPSCPPTLAVITVFFDGCVDELILGPSSYIPAAQCFYKALKVYPNTADLLDIYKKTVSEVDPFLVLCSGDIDVVGMFCDGSWHAEGRRGTDSFSYDAQGGLISTTVQN